MSDSKRWFIGDGVLVMYGDRDFVRITPRVPALDVHEYLVQHLTRGTVVTETLGEATFPDLRQALTAGEEWLI